VSRSKYELVILIRPTVVTDEASTWPDEQGEAAEIAQRGLDVPGQRSEPAADATP